MNAFLLQLLRNTGIQLRRAIYFDNNATTPLDPRVHRYMTSVQQKHFGNASSLHLFGMKAREIIEESRRSVAQILNADPSEIVFTSGGTEGNNTVIRSIARSHPRGHCITSSIEHPSVLKVFQSLEADGFTVTYLGIDENGRVRVNDLEAAIRPETILISVMHVNNELGTIQPIEEIGAVAAAKGIPFHCDAVQSFGKLPFDVKAIPVDYVTCSAHKINGPKGAGAIFIRRGAALEPLLVGGHQERLLRPGTEALVNIAGFGRACELVSSKSKAEYLQRTARIKSLLIDGITQIFPNARVNGSAAHALPTTLNVTLPGIPNSEILAYLDFYKIAVSVGSACVAGSSDVSHVLVALGVCEDDIRSSFRISLGAFNTEREARAFIEVLQRFADERGSIFSYLMPGDLLLKDCANGNTLVVDIRYEGQRKEYPPIPAAVRLSATMTQLKTLPRDREIVLVCEDGYLSNLYAIRLRQAGWPSVKSLLGGYKRWRQYHRDDFYYYIMKGEQE
jgi:cysteine desulfurase